ncbi:hypothetical protein PFISCL1PPCAC_13683, partial [Pristionchus fissidentatus]
EIIRYWGYPVDAYEVQTQDGYILTLFRIRHGRNNTAEVGCKRPPIILDHSLLCDSAQFILNPPESSPAMILADAGFDVFLMNHRGTKHSRRHHNFYTSSSRYWKFTLDEYAKYDNPAAIDVVLTIAGEKSLYWLGHSQGAVLGFLTLAENPKYNSKVRTL